MDIDCRHLPATEADWSTANESTRRDGRYSVDSLYGIAMARFAVRVPAVEDHLGFVRQVEWEWDSR